MSSSFPSLSQSNSLFPLPQLSEDTLHYAVYLPPTSEIDPSTTALLITDFVNSLLPTPWLWNKDVWELKLSASGEPGLSTGSEKNKEDGYSLEGRMRVGDAVDDEWLVVWLLREVSKKWPAFIISMQDTDGEFLLIEAAQELPSWVSPENATNRLWLQNGHLHLLPLEIHSSAPPHQIPDTPETDRDIHLTIPDALRSVRTGKYLAAQGLEDAVWDRINVYPKGLSTHLHRAKMYLPVGVAKALRQKPDLIQRAVEAFYVRDPSQLRAASRMTHFPPSDSVLTLTTLTRAAYAQLQGQPFHPPRVFGPEWHVRDLGDDVDAEGAAVQRVESERKWRDLGVKAATGFEIMYREGGKKSRTGTSNSIPEGQDEEFQKFLENLERAGWFGKEMKDSQIWKKRAEEARKGYLDVRSTDVISQRPSFAHLVDTAISSSEIPPEQLAVSPDIAEDDDSWLEVDPDELDGMMLRASGRATQKDAKQGNEKHVEVGEEHGEALGTLAKKFEEFVGGQGDMEGARFLDELSDEDMETDSEDEAVEEEQRRELEKEKLQRIDLLVPGLSSSEEWGSKTQPSAPPGPETSTKNQPEKKYNPLDAIPSSMRPPIFAKQEYDGVVSDSSDDEDDEDDLPAAGTWGRKVAQMKWSEFPAVDGEDDEEAKIEEIDSGDEQEDHRKKQLSLGGDGNLEEEMKRRVWGDEDDVEGAKDNDVVDGDVDMEDETEEFLQFSREALGISDEMWAGILSERQARGAFIPAPPSKTKPSTDDLPSQLQLRAGKKVQFSHVDVPAASHVVAPEHPSNALDSFDNVMKAMDEALSQTRKEQLTASPTASTNTKAGPNTKSQGAKKSTSSANPLPPKPGKGSDLNADFDDFDDEDLAAMDRELRSVLKGAGVDPDDDYDEDMDIEEAKELEGDQKREYEMMRDFLESYRSQGGESGVIGNLFGRLNGDK